jgi:hypothetical protein
VFLRLFLAISLVAAALPTVFACEYGPSTVTCKVVATDRNVFVLFPILKQSESWTWHRENTKPDAMEYGWFAEFGTCTKLRGFQGNQYSISVQLFKFPGHAPQNGSLTDLLRYAQYDMSEQLPSGNGHVRYTRMQNLKVKAREYEGYLLVGSSDPKAVDRLLSSSPKHALMRVRTPDARQSYDCLVRIEYPSSNTPLQPTTKEGGD